MATQSSKLTSISDQEQLNKHILKLLKTRPFSTPEFVTKTFIIFLNYKLNKQFNF